MLTVLVALHDRLVVARQDRSWHVDEHLRGMAPECVAVDPTDAATFYVGTFGHGLWRGRDGGRSWEVVAGMPEPRITAIAAESVGPAAPVEPAGSEQRAWFYAGTEPSRFYRSHGGSRWEAMTAFASLPSAPTWSFPPRPSTHHVRWIQPDPVELGRVYAAIEAGALVRGADHGAAWEDRAPDGPYDTHTLATHANALGRLYSAAGDGYFESADGGRTWRRDMRGLRHGYLVGVAVDAADPDIVVVSASSGPRSAYTPPAVEAYVYRKADGGAWEVVTDGLPAPKGTTASRFARATGGPAIYAANNRGVFRSADGGRRWEIADLPWKREYESLSVDALVVVED